MRRGFGLLIFLLVVVDADRQPAAHLALDPHPGDCKQNIDNMSKFLKESERRMAITIYRGANQKGTEDFAFEGFDEKMAKLTGIGCDPYSSEIEKIRELEKYLRRQIEDAFKLEGKINDLFIEFVLPAESKATTAFERADELESGLVSLGEHVEKLNNEFLKLYPGWVSDSICEGNARWVTRFQGRRVRKAIAVLRENREIPSLPQAFVHGYRILRPLAHSLSIAMTDQAYDASEVARKLVESYRKSLPEYPSPKGDELVEDLVQELKHEF